LTSPILTDEEIAAICEPLTQGLAQFRFLRDVAKVHVERKPNGKPLVRRCDWERRNGQVQNGPPGPGPKWSKPMY
jgi:hypothetical protein